MSCRKKLNLQLLCKQKLLTNWLPCLCKMTLHFSTRPHDVRRVIRSPANGLPECYICCCRLTLSNERIHCSREHSRAHNRTLCSISSGSSSDSVCCCFHSWRKFACVCRLQTENLRWAVPAGPQHWLAHHLFQVCLAPTQQDPLW